MAGNFGLCEGDHRRAFDFGKFSFVRLFFSKRKVAKLLGGMSQLLYQMGENC